MNNFELPTNIRQIGTAGDGLKIYVEDYVCSYLRQLAESGGHSEKVAFLVGKYMVIDGAPYVFVSGTIQGKHSQFKDNMECLTAQSYEYAHDQLSKYFPGLEIVGWMQSQPGYGVYLNPSYADYHMSNFTRPYHLLFVMDPAEKMSLFYTWNKEMSGIGETPGYFVYYDQNKGMQEYMHDNRIARNQSVPVQAQAEESPLAKLKVFNQDSKASTLERDVRKEAQKTPASASIRTRQDAGHVRTSQNPVAQSLDERKTGRTVEDMRKLSNLLVGLCAVLFITSFILGAGLLQSDGRISEIEDALMTLDSNNLIIADQLRQLSSVAVFAEGDFADHNAAPQQQAPITTPPTVITAPPHPPIETTPLQTEPPADIPATYPNTEAHVNTETHAFANLPAYHIVQPGEGLFGIVRAFYGDLSMLSRVMEANDITDPDFISAGQTLILPRE